jgi:predicted Ser/Thr protein kinase
VNGHFYQPKVFIDELRQIYLRRFRSELFNAFGLIQPESELNQLTEYIQQLRYYVQGEKIKNPHTGQMEDPNETLLREVERRLGVKRDVEEARAAVIQQIAKWSLEHPDQPLEYQDIFEEELRTLRESYRQEVMGAAQARQRELMTHLEGEAHLDDEATRRVESALSYFGDQLGYPDACILEVLHSLHLIED